MSLLSQFSQFGKMNTKNVKRTRAKNNDDEVYNEDVNDSNFISPRTFGSGNQVSSSKRNIVLEDVNEFSSRDLSGGHFPSSGSSNECAFKSNTDPSYFNSVGSGGTPPFSSNDGKSNNNDQVRAELFYSKGSKIRNDNSDRPQSQVAKINLNPSSQYTLDSGDKNTKSSSPEFGKILINANANNNNNNYPPFKRSSSLKPSKVDINKISQIDDKSISELDHTIENELPEISEHHDSGNTDASEHHYSSNKDNIDDPFVKKIILKEALPIINMTENNVREKLNSNGLDSATTLLSFLRAKIETNNDIAEEQLNELEHSISDIRLQLERIDQKIRIVSENATDLLQTAEVANNKVAVLDDWLDGLGRAGSGLKMQLIEWGVRIVSLLSAFFIVIWHIIQAPFKKRDMDLLSVDNDNLIESDNSSKSKKKKKEKEKEKTDNTINK